MLPALFKHTQPPIRIITNYWQYGAHIDTKTILS